MFQFIFNQMSVTKNLAQLNDLGKEIVIYYLSKRILEYDMRYVMIECFCLALV